MNNRPDLLSEASLVRAFKLYLGRADLPEVVLTAPTTSITIEPSVAGIRPFIAAAVLRGVSFDEQTYKAFIAAQEKLHDTFCRARKYASIGTHDLDTLVGPFRYLGCDPKEFSFVPLNQETKVDGLGMVALLENHKLKEYLPLIRDSPVFPLLLDSKDVVCSVPPIINGDHSKIGIHTRNVLIEVTALNRPKAFICLNNLIWAFSEYCERPFHVEPVEIINGSERFLTPNVTPREFTVSHRNAEKLIGA
jgi:phenylalanyl-tRNA synthetase beta chain